MGKKSNQFTYQPPSQETLNDIQKEYDETKISVNNLAKKYGFSICKLYTLKKKGLLRLDRDKSFSHELTASQLRGKKLSEEVKRKISISRKKWIEEHPDKSPYKVSHKSRGESYPERYFRLWLEKEQINHIQEYGFKGYSFDFLINGRIDLEIDGGQHRNDKKIISHDELRDEESRKAGFVVYRVQWNYFSRLSKEQRKEFLTNLKKFFSDYDNVPVPDFVKKGLGRKNKISGGVIIDYEPYMILELLEGGYSIFDACSFMGCEPHRIGTMLKSIGYSLKDIKPKRKLILNHKGMDYVLYDEKLHDKKQQAISLLKQGMSYCEVGKKFNVSDNAIRKWVKSLGENPKHFGRDGKKNKFSNLS